MFFWLNFFPAHKVTIMVTVEQRSKDNSILPNIVLYLLWFSWFFSYCMILFLIQKLISFYITKNCDNLDNTCILNPIFLCLHPKAMSFCDWLRSRVGVVLSQFISSKFFFLWFYIIICLKIFFLFAASLFCCDVDFCYLSLSSFVVFCTAVHLF